jgi:hypothetical protein
MSKEKDYFDSITTKMVLSQLFKSLNTMRIVSLKTTSYAVHNTSNAYCREIQSLILELAHVHFGVIKKKELDEIPSAKYVDPTMHLNDINYYLDNNRKLFKTSQESNIIDEILKLISKTKNLLTLE